MKTTIKYLIHKHKACLKHVSCSVSIFINLINLVFSKILFRHINKTTITINYLKNIYILLLCVNLLFINSQVFSQKDLEGCVWTEYFYAEGQISSSGCLINGSPEGIWESFYKDNSIKSNGLRKSSKLQGIWIFYNDDGSIEKEISYRDDFKDGKEIIYGKLGDILSETNWILDKKEGIKIIYYASDIKKYEINFDNDQKNGNTVEYAIDGRKIAFNKYKNGLIISIEKFNRFDGNGKKTAIWKEFFDNEKIEEEGPFNNGLRHGTFRFYNKKGGLKKIVRFQNGIEVIDDESLTSTEVIRIYHNNGKVSEETSYRNGLKNGVSREMDEDGNIIGGALFSDGEKIANGIFDKTGRQQNDWEYLYQDGSTKAKGMYENDKRVGKWVFYSPEGWVEQTGYYRNGEFDGKWNWFDVNGFVLRKESYHRGEEDGEFNEYDINKNLVLSGMYKNGMRVGYWIYHVNDHKEEGNYLNGERDGKWVFWYTAKQKMFEGDFSFGQKEGAHKTWYSNGILKSSGKYNGDVKNGKWRYFEINGLLDHTHLYKFGKLWKVDGRRVARKRDSSRN